MAQMDDPLGELREQLSALTSLADGLQRTSTQASGEWVAVIAAEYGAREHVRVLDAATSVVRSFTRTPLVAGSQVSQEARQMKMLAAGVRWRDLYDLGSLAVPGILAHAQLLAEVGEQARVLARVPFKAVIADESLALFAIQGPDPREAQFYLRIRPSGLLTDVIALFDMLWNLAVPMPVVPVPGLTDLEPEILTLLAAGATDEAIGRQLGISLRTVQRRVRALQDRLGVRNRFQAGVQAARQGWI